MRRPMRAAGPLFALGLAGLAAAAGPGAWAAAGFVERLTEARAAAALETIGADWARAEADGLRLRLSGPRPDAPARAAALGALAQVAPLARVEDATAPATAPRDAPAPETRPAPPATAPETRAEAPAPLAADAPAAADAAALAAPLSLLRDGAEITVTGEAHPAMLAALREALSRREPPARLENASLRRAEPPDPERLALARAAVPALLALERAQAEIGPGVLTLSGAAPDAAARARIEGDLRAAAPRGAILLLDISIPPPTLSPFRFALGLRQGEATLLACDMPSASDRAVTARRLGELFPGLGARASALCRLGVGAPSLRWADAARAGAEALERLGAGRFEIADSDARLVAGPDTRPARFEAAARRLAEAMPPAFSLALAPPPEGPRPPAGEEDDAIGPVWFAARRDPGGLRLTGAAPDAPTREAVAAFARARFGGPAVDDALELAEAAPPPAWRRAALAGLDALVPLEEGRLRFDGEALRLAGRALRPGAAREADAALAPAREAGLAARAAVTIDLPALAARLPLPPAACLDRLRAEAEGDPITFDPGAAAIAAGSRPVLDRLAGVLKRCEGLVVEIAGHTDSQGRESTNLALSKARANAVLDALFARGVSLRKMSAEGYGESRPLASNATEAGRARNRRIEFADAAGGEDDA